MRSTRCLEQDVLTISEDETFTCMFSHRKANYNANNSLRKCGEMEKQHKTTFRVGR